MICASSMSAIHGGVGQLSYACANGYLDAWVATKAASQQNCCYRTINWDIWQDGGMSVQELPAGLRRHDNLLHLSTGITRREGAEMLYQTMSTPQTQQLVCTTGFTESRWFYQQHIPSRPSMAASSDLADKFSLPLIRKLYAEHLGIEESDNNTSWESMGGDSIQALDLLDELNTKSPRPFTLAEFMQLDTPEALYRFITDDTATAKPSQQISKMAVAQMVLLHPIGGDLLAYREMLKMLDSRVSVIQIQDPMLDGQVLAEDTLVERAAVYCRQVLPQLKDNCPLIVVGWSFGALLAYQMVAMSELQSKKPVLIMIDPPAAYSWQTPPTDDSQLHGFAKELNYKLHDITLPQVKLLMMGKASEGLDLPPFTRNYVANLLQAFRRNLTCLRSFIPGCPPQVMTYLLYASQSQQAMQFWRQQLKTAECICIEGNHYSILNSNNGKELFSQLNRIIAIVINARAVTVYSHSIEHTVT
ncbi:thioesterase domain-containing protein [Arsenophonus sp.]|uniref:thioesterase domain-containing protein n=2 Tax=unclassified Arsenophonus TaxID=2627083 RepID=UPI00286D894F|nr:thioesterase domain-containing protein [Arsenophonus sp.]